MGLLLLLLLLLLWLWVDTWELGGMILEDGGWQIRWEEEEEEEKGR